MSSFYDKAKSKSNMKAITCLLIIVYLLITRWTADQTFPAPITPNVMPTHLLISMVPECQDGTVIILIAAWK